MASVKARETTARKKLAARGLRLEKSGDGYQVVSTKYYIVEAGEGFTLTLEQVEDWAKS